MAISYGYVDPKEMSAFQLIEPGEGTFKVTNAEEKISRNGNPMMVITFMLTNHRGQQTLYNEYIISSKDPVQNKSAATKVYNILRSLGRDDLYGHPLEARHVLHGKGKCIIKTQKSDDPQYSDKSVIAQYIADEAKAPQGTEPVDINDDLPF